MADTIQSKTGSLDRGKDIKTSLSPRILIKVKDANKNEYVIAAAQTFNPTEDRTLTRIQEISTDGVIEIVPTSATQVTISMSRIVWNMQRLPQALKQTIRHIHAARKPFDIVVYDFNVGLNPKITIFENCWMQSYNYTYSSDNYVITENATIWAERVYDNDSPTTGTDNIEEMLNRTGEGGMSTQMGLA